MRNIFKPGLKALHHIHYDHTKETKMRRQSGAARAESAGAGLELS